MRRIQTRSEPICAFATARFGRQSVRPADAGQPAGGRLLAPGGAGAQAALAACPRLRARRVVRLPLRPSDPRCGDGARVEGHRRAGRRESACRSPKPRSTSTSRRTWRWSRRFWPGAPARDGDGCRPAPVPARPHLGPAHRPVAAGHPAGPVEQAPARLSVLALAQAAHPPDRGPGRAGARSPGERARSHRDHRRSGQPRLAGRVRPGGRLAARVWGRRSGSP